MGRRRQESDGEDVQRRLFVNGAGAVKSSSSPTLSVGQQDIPEETSSDTRERRYVSLLVILALLAALIGTYIVEMEDASKILKSVPAQLAIVSTLWGLASCAFTWWYTYFDSHDPGSFPTSPLKLTTSPVRKQTEVQWHLSYIMAPVNGVVAMCLYLYWKLVWVAEHQSRVP